MFNRKNKIIDSLNIQLNETTAVINAIDDAVAKIEFTPQGEILSANDLFLAVVGYSLEEIKGQHHGIFCSEDYRASREYSEFWYELASGIPQSGQFLRVAKFGKEVWLNAS